MPKKVPATGNSWSVVPQALRPPARVPGFAALQEVELLEARSLTTTEFGTAGVRVLLTKSPRTERLLSAFGVTTQEQQETSCSSGENVYTFTQRSFPELPALVIFTTESPTFRFDA